MDVPAASGPGRGWVAQRNLPRRSKLRNSTLIIPATGERSRRQVSFGLPTFTRGSQAHSTSHLSGNFPRLQSRFTAFGRATWTWIRSEEGRAVFACSLAYLIGSLAVFWPRLSAFVGYRDGKHNVATIVVFFHPARTIGSMLEAVAMSIAAVVYAGVTCLLAMVFVSLMGERLGALRAAHVVLLVLFVGGGLGFVGWVKQKFNSPLSNVACILASISIISVLTKEDALVSGYISTDKIVQMLRMLLVAISTTVIVNLLVWRQSARVLLRKSARRGCVSLGTMLSVTANGFLNGSDEDLRSAGFGQVETDFESAHADMTGRLREAKWERHALGSERLYQLEKALAKSIEAISRALGGLRSASSTQFVLLRAVSDISSGAANFPVSPTRNGKPGKERAPTLAAIDELEELVVQTSVPGDGDRERWGSRGNRDSGSDTLRSTPQPCLDSPSDIFELFITMLGPSMKSLAWTLSEILLVSPFSAGPGLQVAVGEQYRDSLREALDLYNANRHVALQELYQRMGQASAISEGTQAMTEEVAAACGHFSFSLLTVADEVDSYLDILDDIKAVTGANRRSWKWLKPWGAGGRSGRMGDHLDLQALLPKPVQAIRKSAMPKGIADSMKNQRDKFHWDASPQASHMARATSQGALRVLRFLARDDVRFGIKVAIGAIVWGSFAFMPSTRPIYHHWRGEWGLLSFMIVVSMTQGASHTMGLARFIGTVLGAMYALTAWYISGGNGWALALLGWLISLPNFCLILGERNGALGRITLLAYNVMALYGYSLSQVLDDDGSDDDEGGRRPLMVEICYHRFVAVTLGIVWGIVVCRVVWPISGRQRFREGLAVLHLKLGLIWKRRSVATLLSDETIGPHVKEGEQAALQRYASKLNVLRDAAQSEFSLRGPFPGGPYGRMMASTGRILDGLYAMRLVAGRRTGLGPGPGLTVGERAVLAATAVEREQLRNRVCDMFQAVASSLMLEFPVSDAAAGVGVEDVKDRLLGQVRRLRADGAVAEHDLARLYASTLVTMQVAQELRLVRAEIEGLFGVWHDDTLLLQ